MNEIFDFNDVPNLISPFEPVFQKCGQTFRLEMNFIYGFRDVWNILAPLIEQSMLKRIDLCSIDFVTEDLKKLTETICHHQALEELRLLYCRSVSFDGMKFLLQSMPPTVRRVSIEWEESRGTENVTQSKYETLIQLAQDQGIYFKCLQLADCLI
ncbi:hypothetical protein AC1031_011389 [Aphanomyces cochlioides]|nr:hypothetical protein AC1031_011389 [Aphanomyces cochlioides]